MARPGMSCRLAELELPYEISVLSDVVREVDRSSGLRSCYIRPAVFRGCGTFSVDGRSCPVHVSVIVTEMGKYLGRMPLRWEFAQRSARGVGLLRKRRFLPRRSARLCRSMDTRSEMRGRNPSRGIPPRRSGTSLKVTLAPSWLTDLRVGASRAGASVMPANRPVVRARMSRRAWRLTRPINGRNVRVEAIAKGSAGRRVA